MVAGETCKRQLSGRRRLWWGYCRRSTICGCGWGDASWGGAPTAAAGATSQGKNLHGINQLGKASNLAAQVLRGHLRDGYEHQDGCSSQTYACDYAASIKHVYGVPVDGLEKDGRCQWEVL